jgi:hypothetical protein
MDFYRRREPGRVGRDFTRDPNLPSPQIRVAPGEIGPRRGWRGSDTTVTPEIGSEGVNWVKSMVELGIMGKSDKANYATLIRD